jgi:hypothetical protein
MRVVVSSFWIELGIFGEDGSVLKGQDDPRTFWRGVLPATQDYYVELTLVGAAREAKDFELSVLINPRGQTTQWQAYRDAARGFELEYSDYFIQSAPPPAMPLMKGEIALSLSFVGSEYFESTNLDEVYLVVGSTEDADIVSSCMDPVGAFEKQLGEETVNSIAFQKGAFSEGAAGNIYTQEIYRTRQGNTCYEIGFIMHYANIGNYGPDSGIREFDDEAVQQKLREVLLTFRFTE